MGRSFNALSPLERAAVTEFVGAEYDRLVFQQPASYVSQNAQANPQHWQQALCELIASDPIRVSAIMEAASRRKANTSGFTLIEMAIVLVVIGLVVGGGVVGRDLIKAAAMRAQITQIEKYNTAANTFRGKYSYLPGDINATAAAQFGFIARTGAAGLGDGNGLIQGNVYGGGGVWPASQGGETLFFWEDLSSAGLIDGTFNTATSTGSIGGGTTTNFAPFFPSAKIGNGNIVYVYSGGSYSAPSASASSGDGRNYFGLSVPSALVWSGELVTGPGLTVAQAYAIDTKLDDGLPYSGNVLALYVSGGWNATNDGVPSAPASVDPSSTTCVDLDYSFSNPAEYSMSQNGGSGVNCALSFRMQAGD